MARFDKWGIGGSYLGADITSALMTSKTIADTLGSLDTTRVMKDAVASMQIGKSFDPVDMDGIAGSLNVRESLGESLKALDTSRLMKDAVASMQIGKTFDPVDMHGIAGSLKASEVLAESLRGFDTSRLMKDAVASMQIGKTFDPSRVKSVAEMLGGDMAALGTLGGQVDFDHFFEAESEADPEASFVRALIGGWFLQLPLPVRFALVLSALDLLLASASCLDAAGAIEVPEPETLVISTAVALVAFVLAIGSTRSR